MMPLYLILEYAIGDVRGDIVTPKQSLAQAMEYYSCTPSLLAILDILDIICGLGELPRHRYIAAPFGHSLETTFEHVRICSNSAYRSTIDMKLIAINDWCRYDGDELGLGASIYELRKVLLTHILKDNVLPQLDEYICTYYMIIIKSLIRASHQNMDFDQ